jgi:hypothetical protein
MAKTSSILAGTCPGVRTLFGAVDPAAHHVEAKVGETRFAALLSPFRSEADALAALKAAGATVIGGAA